MNTYTIHFDIVNYEVAGTEYAWETWKKTLALAEALCVKAYLMDNITGEILADNLEEV